MRPRALLLSDIPGPIFFPLSGTELNASHISEKSSPTELTELYLQLNLKGCEMGYPEISGWVQ